MIDKQVDKKHYVFSKYMHKRRWSSIWCQLDEISNSSAETVLEIGPGTGIFKAAAQAIGINIESVDIDHDLKPDYVASATNLPFDDESYDVACGFQILEHLPFEDSLLALTEMSRISKNSIIFSLPDSRILYPFSFHLPKLGECHFFIPKPIFGNLEHKFDGQHYWEVNKKGYELSKIINIFSETIPNFTLARTYRVPNNPYHRFFVYERT